MDTPDGPDAMVVDRQSPYDIDGPVAGVIVDEYHLPGNSRERLAEPVDKRDDVFPLIEGRHHNRKLYLAAQRWSGPRDR